MLIIGQNSWVTVNEADEYLKVKFNTAAWFTLASSPNKPGTVAKESLLISAFYWLMSSPEIQLTATLTDINVKNAQIESAWYLYSNGDELFERQKMIEIGLKSFKFSKRQETFISKNEISLPRNILALLSIYQTGTNTIIQLKGEHDA